MSELVKRDVRYLNKDFAQFRKNLIDFAKAYFPDTYNDFNESDPATMYVEMASYVGDVLGFYLDNQLKESLLSQAQEKANIIATAAVVGYKVKNKIASSVELDVFQLLPSIQNPSGSGQIPDWNYSLVIPAGMVVKSEKTSVEFRTLEMVDFTFSSSYSPTELSVYQINETTNEPEYYLLKKSVKAISGTIKSADYVFDSPKRYDKIVIEDDDIIDVLDIVDSEDNTWTNVPYLAQETVFETVANIAQNNSELYGYRNSAPYLLQLRKTARRYVTKFRSDNSLEIQFGAGISSDSDEQIIPNPENIGMSLPNLQVQYDQPLDPTNFLYTRTYGLAPSNTTLTVRYTVGGGLESNVPSYDLTNITSIEYEIDESNLSNTLVQQVKSSVACTNPKPATGGKSEETIEDIRNNALANFATQMRAVTAPDYVTRSYSMPAKFGAIAKAYVIQDDQLVYSSLSNNGLQTVPNPLALNLYTLGYNSSGQLTQLNSAVKYNLKNYLSVYRMMTDAINIKDAYIINIGISYSIVTAPEYNSNEVLLRCTNKLKQIFDTNNIQINQPIVISKLFTELDKIDGVQTVSNITITNLYDSDLGYSGNVYNIDAATRDGVIYPSLDVSIFEVKYPNTDIKGRVVPL